MEKGTVLIHVYRLDRQSDVIRPSFFKFLKIVKSGEVDILYRSSEPEMCMLCIYKEIPYGCFVFCQQKISAQGFECKFRCAGMKTKKNVSVLLQSRIHKKDALSRTESSLTRA